MNTTIVRSMILPVVLALLAVAPASVFAHDNVDKDTVTTRPQTLVQLQANGTALVRGAEVTSISDDVIRAETELGDVTLSWTIDTDADTDFITQNGNTSDLDEIDVGDTISFSGELTGASTVDADVVREWRLPSSTDVAVTGTVKEVNSGSFVLSGTRYGDITVDVDSDTDFVIRGSKNGDLSDLSVGQHVAVAGSYSSDTETLDANKVSLVVMDFKNFGDKVKDWFSGHFHFGFGKK